MRILNQVMAISAMNIKNIPGRLGASLVIVVGMAGVVGVLIALLAMAQGFESAVDGSGQADRALLLRQGSTLELNGSIPIVHGDVIRNLPGIRKSADGTPLIAGETYVSINRPQRNTGEGASVPFRGIKRTTWAVRDEARIVQGRNFQWGKFEIVAGVGAVSSFEGLAIGDTVPVHGISWTIVGYFDTGGTAHESELWADVTLVNQVFGRGNTYSSMTTRLTSRDAFARLESALAGDKRLKVDVRRETDYYTSQSRSTSRLLLGIGTVITVIMSLGAIFAALNTMYAAVATRTFEIATLRAIGFERLPIVVSVITEATLLALVGGTVGGVLAWALLNGYTASTVGGTYTKVAFAFEVNGSSIALGIAISCSLGMIGSLFPAIHAARLPLSQALRAGAG